MSCCTKRSYFAVIPAAVRYDEDLPPNAKLLYGEITALCNSDGFCWASNKYFADLYGVSALSISRWVSALVKKGYITSQIIYKEGTNEIDKRYLQICIDPPIKNDNTPPIKNDKENNTEKNNTLNNTIERERERKREKEKKPSRHKYGEYENVLLSDEDMDKLKREFPGDYQERIERLSSYIETSGKSYKNHLAVIRKWAREDMVKNDKPSMKRLDNYHDTNATNYDDMLDALMKDFEGGSQ